MASVGPLTATWSADTSSSTKYPNDGSDYAGYASGEAFRTAIKFDISSLPADGTVTQVDFSIGCLRAVTSKVHNIGCYGSNGQGNPESDSAATMFSDCVSTNVYVSATTSFQSTGLKTFTDLGSQANSDVEAARDAGSIFSLAIKQTDESTDYCTLAEYTHGTNPPKLTITYTTPKGLIMLMGDGGFM